MYVLIDNYDSFTYNLFHFLGELGAEVDVHRNDAITAAAVVALAPEGIVISPGPCDPDRAGICLDLVKAAADTGMPLLGVCLGHQAIGQAFGGHVVRAPQPMHGKISTIRHDGTGVFAELPTPFHGDALPFAGGRSGDLAEHALDHRRDRRRRDHGRRALRAADARRAVPSREHRLGARPHPAPQLPQDRRKNQALSQPRTTSAKAAAMTTGTDIKRA